MIIQKYITVSVEIEVDVETLIQEARSKGKLDRASLRDVLETILKDQDGDASNWSISDDDQLWDERDGFDGLVREAEEQLEGLCDMCKLGQCGGECRDPDCSCEDCPHEPSYECPHCGAMYGNGKARELFDHEQDCPANPNRVEDEDDEE